jgi:hypothetical protein
MPARTANFLRLACAAATVVGLLACAIGKLHGEPRAPASPVIVPARANAATLRLADAGKTRLVIHAPARLLEEPPELETVEPGKSPRKRKPSAAEKEAEQSRMELAAAVTDLARVLGQMTGAEVPVQSGPPAADDRRWPILIGELGAERFGPITRHSLGAQTFRAIVKRSAIALYGESDLSSSYAIYELLHRLGCRWYMPGELGEVIPRRPTLELAELDVERAPSMLYRGIWYADADYKRRNRTGGVQISAGHTLERYITEEQREQHPEWRAIVNGQLHPSRLRWSNPALADAIAASIATKLEKRPTGSVSLSPGDGLGFDEGDDRALDAGDFDPTMNGVSLTDRLFVLVNRVATRLEVSHPELLVGLYAYVSYTRPPVRETVHPNVVPVIAPITYCRTRPWSDSRCPGNDELRNLIEGWSRRAKLLAFRGYVFNLAEPAAPNPMMRKWSEDMSFLLANHFAFYQPESMPTFEVNLPALYLGLRLSFDGQLAPATVLDELFRDFYGSAAAAVRAYSEFVDRTWYDSTDFAGGNLGHANRFTDEVLREARRLLEVAQAACRTAPEKARVAMLDASLGQFERYMALSVQLRTGQLRDLAANYQRWLDEAARLAEHYAPNSAFGKAHWAGDAGIYASYAQRFVGVQYLEADRIAREERLLTARPLCRFDYAQVDAPATASLLSGAEQRATDVCKDTWSSLGMHDYFGAVRYRTSIAGLPAPGAKSHLWLSRVDGIVSVWLNGAPAQPVAARADEPPSSEAHLRPITFDVSGLARAGSNELVIVVQRTTLAELGGGGLLGPVYLYRDR